MTLKNSVYEALNNAAEGDYGDLVLNGSAYVVALDLLDCCAAVEGCEAAEIARLVEDWQIEQATARGTPLPARIVSVSTPS